MELLSQRKHKLLALKHIVSLHGTMYPMVYFSFPLPEFHLGFSGGSPIGSLALLWLIAARANKVQHYYLASTDHPF